jgi:serine/threonine protein kinase
MMPIPEPEPLKQKVPRDVPLDKFIVIGRSGQGSYGEVYKAITPLGAHLAVKVMQKRDAKVTEMQRREVELLKELSGQHPSIVNLLGWRSSMFNIQLLMPWYQADLHDFISKKGHLINVGVARKCAQQMTMGVSFLHDRKIVHRDIKPSNIFVRYEPLHFVIGDFGMARKLLPPLSDHAQPSAPSPLTADCTTLWYRAPEALLTPSAYSYPSDVWSMAATIAEIETKRAIFAKSTEVDVLLQIFRVLGTPSPEEWPEISKHKGIRGTFGAVSLHRFAPPKQQPWGRIFGEPFRDFLNSLFRPPPQARATAETAASHQWLSCCKGHQEKSATAEARSSDGPR